jgi:hypothetical protein
VSGRLIAIAAVLAFAACEHGKGGGVLDGRSDADLGPDAGPGSHLRCGGFAGIQCPTDELCDFRPNNCGRPDELGLCVTRPLTCDLVIDPVCGCDGRMHDNACLAAMAGVDVDASNSCFPMP